MPTTTYTPRDHAVRALACAMGEVGIHEAGGNNRGQRVELYQRTAGGVPGESWCADFGCFCDAKALCLERNLLTAPTDAGKQDIIVARASDLPAAFHIPRTGSCIEVYRAAVAQGRWRGPMFTPQAGDITLWDFKREGEPHHYGRVIRVLSTGQILEVDGNTPDTEEGSQEDGDGVFQKTRGREFLFGIVHFGQ